MNVTPPCMQISLILPKIYKNTVPHYERSSCIMASPGWLFPSYKCYTRISMARWFAAQNCQTASQSKQELRQDACSRHCSLISAIEECPGKQALEDCDFAGDIALLEKQHEDIQSKTEDLVKFSKDIWLIITLTKQNKWRSIQRKMTKPQQTTTELKMSTI